MKLFPPITLTLDNGTEFLGFKDLEQNLDIKVYFADAHAPWQRGSNENVNGLIRFFFPRGTDFTKVTDQQLDIVLNLINNRPRKCLGFLSPLEYINHDRQIVRGIVYDDKGYFYFVRVDRDDLFGKLTHLETPGGGVNENEDIKLALKREIAEECGMIIDIIDELGIIEDDYNIIHRHNISCYYLCREVGRCDSRLEDYEKELFISCINECTSSKWM